MCTPPHWEYTENGLKYQFYAKEDKTYRTVITVLGDAPEIFETFTLHNQRIDPKRKLLNVSEVYISEEKNREKKFIIKNLTTKWNIKSVTIHDIDQLDYTAKESNTIVTDLNLHGAKSNLVYADKEITIKKITGNYNLHLSNSAITDEHVIVDCETLDVVKLEIEQQVNLKCTGDIKSKSSITVGLLSTLLAKNMHAENIIFNECEKIKIENNVSAKKIALQDLRRVLSGNSFECKNMSADRIVISGPASILVSNQMTTSELEISNNLTDSDLGTVHNLQTNEMYLRGQFKIDNDCKINNSFEGDAGSLEIMNKFEVNGDLTINDRFHIKGNSKAIVRKNFELYGTYSGENLTVFGDITQHTEGHFQKIKQCDVHGRLKLYGQVEGVSMMGTNPIGRFYAKKEIFIETSDMKVEGIKSDQNVNISNCYLNNVSIDVLEAQQVKLTNTTLYTRTFKVTQDLILESDSQVLHKGYGEFKVARDIISNDSKLSIKEYISDKDIQGKFKLSNGSVVKLCNDAQFSKLKIESDPTSLFLLGNRSIK